MDDSLSPNVCSKPWIYDEGHWEHDQWESDRRYNTICGLDPGSSPSKLIARSTPVSESPIVEVGIVYTHFINAQRAPDDDITTQERIGRQSRKQCLNTNAHDAATDDPVYLPLKGSQDIRVLELCAGGSEDQLNGSLHICSVEFEYPTETKNNPAFRYYTLHAMSCTSGEPVWYTALSYVWGDPALGRTMTCNNKPVAITKNLELALRHLRRRDVSILLWVDQICINQDDFHEKSQQVVLMGTIFQRAWSTLVWLGEETDDSNDALDTLLDTKHALQYYMNEVSPRAEDFERLFLPAFDSPKWMGLGKLMSRPWFQRIWIIQEVVMSHQIIIVCGTRCISWEDLDLFAICVIDNDFERYLYRPGISPEQAESAESGYIRARKIGRVKNYNDSFSQKTTFLAGLVEGRGAQATNPRDKVFAIMGLANTQIYPNYSSKVIDVFIEAALRIASTPELDNLLCCVDHLQPTATQPSWVPDWATPRQTMSLGYDAKNHQAYQASKDLKMQSRTEMTETGAALVVTGIVVDTITRVGMVTEEPDLKDVLTLESVTSHFVLEGMKLAIELCQPYPSSKWTLFEAFCQTLVAGKDHSSFWKAPEEYSPIFALLFDTAIGSSPSFPDQPSHSTKRRLTVENLQRRSPARTYRRMQVAMRAAVKCRRLGVTTQRYLGLFPRGTKTGDHICVFVGCCVPFVLRQYQNTNDYQLVGECYLHGIMDGELDDMKEMQKGEIRLR